MPICFESYGLNKGRTVITISDYESVFKAAADPVRVRILKLLEGRELCVCELIDVLGLGQSTVSGHLLLMKKAGLVKDRREGRWAHYSLIDRKTNPYALPILALLLGWLEDDAAVRADRRRLVAIQAKSKSSCG
ncbi:MAG: metalloregulator ArsR/SmtB family transcription factor [Thermoleophilia bacterium]|nr:metalloregulator ArsR/SmtB family transcription factor [Thermoleophilia bacterium]